MVRSVSTALPGERRMLQPSIQSVPSDRPTPSTTRSANTLGPAPKWPPPDRRERRKDNSYNCLHFFAELYLGLGRRRVGVSSAVVISP